jgi:hypothetical protein
LVWAHIVLRDMGNGGSVHEQGGYKDYEGTSH